MKKVITIFFSKWIWSFLLFLFSTTFLLIYLFYSDNVINKGSNLSLFIGSSIILLFGTSLLMLIISSIRIVFQRKWIIITSIIILSCIGIYTGILFLMSSVIATFQPDGFADNLIIPNNIKLNIPKDISVSNGEGESDSINVKDFPDFELYQTELPGIYQFILWRKKIEKGTVFLKAYEITGEQSLSAIELRQNSAIQISNPTNEIKEFGPSTFKIKEGDWGKFYAARFEVWFFPDKSNKEEIKLMDKIYKIEGYSN